MLPYHFYTSGQLKQWHSNISANSCIILIDKKRPNTPHEYDVILLEFVVRKIYSYLCCLSLPVYYSMNF